MNNELTNKLFNKYPKIFQGRFLPITQSLIPFGFECGNGWYNIINRLCSDLQWNTDNNNRPNKEGKYPYPQIVASQVKEKYGSLCFYVEGATIEQYAVISFVETLSGYICEKCGSMKNIGQTQGWISTLCKECRDPNSNWKLNTENQDETNNKI